MIEHIWEGIYPHFRDAPKKGRGFAGETWVRRSLEAMADVREEAASASPCLAAYNRTLLPVVAAMAAAPAGRLTLLDFGGGLGANYYHVRDSLPRQTILEHHIVEVPPICAAGREFFAAEPDIRFHEAWPRIDGRPDLLHMGSSVQYVEDWRETLAMAAGYAPRYLLFSDLLAGDIPTYASVQVYYESFIPTWFFNRGEFIGAVADLGYRLAFSSRFFGRFLGVEREVPQENFPESHRLRRACHLLFIPEGGAQ